MKRIRPCLACLLLLLFFAACGKNSEGNDPVDGGTTDQRHYAFRAIGGFSMGAMVSATMGLRHHTQFDAIMAMGGALDLGLFIYILGNEVFSGFCQPPQAEQMCRESSLAQDYEQMDCGGPNAGGFDRRQMIEAYQDAVIAWGNFASYNPDHPYLPAGLTEAIFAQSKEEACANPVRLENYYDWRFNPEGSHPVITFCEGNGPDRGVFDPTLSPYHPVEIVLAVDLNDNGRRDAGEPVIYTTGERYQDLGADGLASADEPGYHAVDLPDPAGDDYHPMDNPLGSEGNHRREEGEPYLDFGLDGVEGTTDSPYDFGEGNGAYDDNPNIIGSRSSSAAELLQQLTDEDLAQMDFYMDVGVRDHMRFRPVTESFAGLLQARGRPVDVYDGFSTLMPDPQEAFEAREVDWSSVGRDVLVRYGDPEASPSQIEAGDGGHVGTIAQMLYRFFASAAWLSASWPDGDFRRLPSDSRSQLLESTCHSEILDKDWAYSIFLPPGYDEHPNDRYPVLYLVHGSGMTRDDLKISAVFMEPWMVEGSIQKFIIVFPNGRCGDECIDATFLANQKGRDLPPLRYEDAFIQELLPCIDASYRTRAPEDLDLPAE